MTVENGQEPRVSFDADHPDKTISLADATTMLQGWRKRNPSQFGFWLAEALTGAQPAKASRVRPAAGAEVPEVKS